MKNTTAISGKLSVIQWILIVLLAAVALGIPSSYFCYIYDHVKPGLNFTQAILTMCIMIEAEKATMLSVIIGVFIVELLFLILCVVFMAKKQTCAAFILSAILFIDLICNCSMLIVFAPQDLDLIYFIIKIIVKLILVVGLIYYGCATRKHKKNKSAFKDEN